MNNQVKNSAAACGNCNCAESCTTANCACTQSGSCKTDNCSKCGSPLKSGMKYQDICTTCEPTYLQRCSSCQRQLWNCMCIRPHAWD